MNTKFTKQNDVQFNLMGVIRSFLLRKSTISGVALTTLLVSNGTAFATQSNSATSYKFGSSNTTEFLAQATPDAQNAPDAQIQTDPVNAVEKRKPTQFKATVDALAPYVVEGADGSITIKAPPEVINSLDKESYTAIRDSVSRANQSLGSNNAQLRRLPPIPWRPIYNAVKKARKWVWYKSHLCTAAVIRDWSRITSSSPDPNSWIVDAAITCGNAMRR